MVQTSLFFRYLEAQPDTTFLLSLESAHGVTADSTFGRTGFSRLYLGNYSQYLQMQSKKPVLEAK